MNYLAVVSVVSCSAARRRRAPFYSQAKKTKATMAAKALAPNTLSLPPTAPLLLLLPESLLQSTVKPVAAQSELLDVELPLEPEVPDPLPSPPTTLPTPLPLEPPGTELAVEAELLAEAELAPLSMSVPVPSRLARMVGLSPSTTVLFVPAASL